MAGNGWSIGWNTRSSTSMSTPKRRLASSCGVAWSKTWVFLRRKIKVEFVEWGTRWTVLVFFVAELCKVRIFARVFGMSFGKGAHQQHPKNWGAPIQGSYPILEAARDKDWHMICLLSLGIFRRIRWFGSSRKRSWVEDSVQMTGDNDSFNRGFQFQCLLKDENYTLSANFAESFFPKHHVMVKIVVLTTSFFFWKKITLHDDPTTQRLGFPIPRRSTESKHIRTLGEVLFEKTRKLGVHGWSGGNKKEVCPQKYIHIYIYKIHLIRDINVYDSMIHHSKKSPTGPTERTPKPGYLIALLTFLGVRS